MTISTDTATASYTGNGTTTAFPIPFYFLVDTDVKISKKDGATGTISVLTLNSDYTLTGAGNQAGGTATMTVAPLGGTTPDQLFIERNVDAVQETAYPENGIFPAASHEKALDRLTMLVQQILSKLTFGLFRDPLSAAYDAGGNKVSNIADAVDPQDVPSLHQVQELIVDGAVPGLSGDAGSSLVGFKQAGTGAVSRTAQDKLREAAFSVKDFGAKGDGTTDDKAAIQATIDAAVAAGISRILLPAGTYAVSSQFIITSPIRLIGQGNGFVANADWPATIGTTIKWTGSGTAVFTFQNCNFGNFGMEGITIDCNSLAIVGLQVADSAGGHFQNVGIRNYATRGLWLNSTTTHTSNTNAWHYFCGLSLDSTVASVAEAVRLSGFSGRGNACHNTFVNTRIQYGGTANGLVLGGCDNNTFLLTYIYRSSGSGYGVYCDDSEQSGFPINNSFFHLEAGGGWYQPSSLTSSTANIYGYMRDNGEPLPTLNANGSLALNCGDVVYPLTVAKGTGWSGGSPSFTSYYSKSGRQVTLNISFSGSAVVAASGATITGVPSNGSFGLGMVYGVNTGGAGGAIAGYLSGGTIVLSSGITSTSGAQLTCTYLV